MGREAGADLMTHFDNDFALLGVNSLLQPKPVFFCLEARSMPGGPFALLKKDQPPDHVRGAGLEDSGGA